MLKLFAKKKPETDLDAVLGDFELPTFPAVIMAALEKVRDENAGLSDIADVVSADPGLTVRLLGTVNSAAFGLRHEVRSVHHAISLLGRSPLESMLIGLAVRDSLPDEPSRGFEPPRFWRTAARRAIAARALADEMDPSNRSECFTAALLSDMAIPVLCRARGGDYGPVLEQWHEGAGELADLEESAFGWTHAGVAGSMCRRWEFPEQIASAIAAHHDPPESSDAGLAPVHLVAPLRETDDDAAADGIVDAVQRAAGLAADRTRAILEDSFGEAEHLARLFSR